MDSNISETVLGSIASHSPTTAQIFAALAKAQKKFRPVKKTRTGYFDNREYKYADLADVLDMARPRLAAQGIATTQPTVLVDNKLRIVTLLTHESGEWIQTAGIAIPEQLDPQAFGRIHTYWRRYDLCGLLAVAGEDDLDAADTTLNNESSEGKPPKSSPHQRATNDKGEKYVTGRQVKRMRAIAAEQGWSRVGLNEIVSRYGFVNIDLVTDPEPYDTICQELKLRRPDTAPEQRTGTDNTLPFPKDGGPF